MSSLLEELFDTRVFMYQILVEYKPHTNRPLWMVWIDVLGVLEGALPLHINFYHFHSSLLLIMNHPYPTFHLYLFINTLQFPVAVFSSFQCSRRRNFVGDDLWIGWLTFRRWKNPMDQVGREVGQRLAEQQAQSTLVFLMLPDGVEDEDDDVTVAIIIINYHWWWWREEVKAKFMDHPGRYVFLDTRLHLAVRIWLKLIWDRKVDTWTGTERRILGFQTGTLFAGAGTYKDAIFVLWWPELKFIVRSTLQIVGWLSLQQWNAQNWPLLSSCEKALLWIYWNHICCWYTAYQENYRKLIILQRSELIHNEKKSYLLSTPPTMQSWQLKV